MSSIPPIEPYPLPAEADLPVSIADWTVRPDRAVLLVHDMQRYFLRPFSGVSPAPELVRNIARLREQSARLDIPIAYTAQPGGMTDDQRGLLKDFWGPGMDVAPEDRRIVDGLEPAGDDWLLTKWRYSAFFKTDLLARMRAAGRDQLILCGVYAHVGVLMTAVDAFTNDIQAFLVADGVADFSSAHHRQALVYAAERCAVVRTVENVSADLAAVRREEVTAR